MMKTLFREFYTAIWEVFKLPFFLIAEGFRRLFALGWRKLVMLSAAAVILTFVVLGLFFEVTTHPDFCGSCHLMRPYIAAWEHSSHADVSCMKCHAKPGLTGYLETKFTAMSMLANYATGLYKRSKPWAEIEDANCLTGGCHQTRLLDGEIEFTRGIKFDHTPHLSETRRGRKLRCTSCHSQIVQGEHISVTTSTCFLCHFKNVTVERREELANCTLCHQTLPGMEGYAPMHNLDTELISSDTHGDVTEHIGAVKKEADWQTSQDAGAVPALFDHTNIVADSVACNTCHQRMWSGNGNVLRERCGSCHSQAEHINRIDDLEFIHEMHIEKRKVECQRCHDAITHQNPPLVEHIEGNCNTCHANPHSPMLAVYSGTGSRLVDEVIPDIMYQSGVVCASCHRDLETGMSEANISSDVTCAPCHKDNYLTLAKDWRKGYQARVADMQRALAQAGSHPQIESVRHDLALLSRGGSWHNPKFADKVLDAAGEVLGSAGAKIKKPANVPAASRECLTCHAAILSANVSLPWSDFDHPAHISERNLNCTQCHIGGKPEERSHGQRKASSQACVDCHHSPENEECATCHFPSQRTYRGEIPEKPSAPSPMADMGMVCTDCHDASVNYQPPDTEQCLGCHDQEVVDNLEFVRAEIHTLIEDVGKRPSREQQIVIRDPGRAVHHPDLAKELLKK
ncbi:NapC/NirT family cytochrome c [bacterium]|nr:NapC/NirT family cytochrome c [bacterium]